MGPRGWKGEVCRIRLCGIRYNPFCLILRRSEKPCQACTAAIEDLQSQYLQAWGNLAPWAKNIHHKALFFLKTHTSEISNTYCTVYRIAVYGDMASLSGAGAVPFFRISFIIYQAHTVLTCFLITNQKTVTK